jgi:hypothetical protein
VQKPATPPPAVKAPAIAQKPEEPAKPSGPAQQLNFPEPEPDTTPAPEPEPEEDMGIPAFLRKRMQKRKK